MIALYGARIPAGTSPRSREASGLWEGQLEASRNVCLAYEHLDTRLGSSACFQKHSRQMNRSR